MLIRLKTPLMGLLLVILFGNTANCADTAGVRDNGDFFSDAAKKEANRKIAEMEQKYKKELVVESFTEIPEEVKRGVDLADKGAVSRMFEQWTVKEAKQQKVNGIYILLSREPAHLQIVVGNDTQKQAFTPKDRDNLASLMLGKLRSKKNDEALSECVQFVATTISSHAAHPKASSAVASHSNTAVTAKAPNSEQAFPWGLVFTAVLGLGAVWLIVGVLRSFMGRGAATAPGMMPGAGGGMFSSLLGGMFGAAAGMWLYDQFSGNHGNAWGGEQENRDIGSQGYTGQDSDYSGTGGDFGGDYSGGDMGGDMGGGGDF